LGTLFEYLMRHCYLRFLLLSAAIIMSFSANGLAQRQLGVHWTPPADNKTAIEQLNQFADLGIQRLLITPPLEETVWERIDTLGFSVHGHIGIRYPTASTFSDPDSTLLAMISSNTNQLISRSSVQSIGIFSLGQIESDRFTNALKPITRQIDSVFRGSLFYITLRPKEVPADSLFDYKLLLDNGIRYPVPSDSGKNTNRPGGYIYTSTDSIFTPAKQVLKKGERDSVPVFLKGDWLLNSTKTYPEFAESLTYYAETSKLVLPLPREINTRQPDHSIIIILLLFIFGLFIISYHYSPVYRRALSRYFFSHKFLVDDIMNRHIRTITPSLVILLQHILAAGIASYCLGYMLFSVYGQDAIQYHYSGFMITSTPLGSFFLWGCLLSLFICLLSVLWIWLININAEIKYFSQVLLLYSWPLQLNIIICLLLVTVMISGASRSLFYLLCILFLTIQLSSFIITSFDTSGNLTVNRIWFLSGSIGLYIVLLSGFAGWVLFYTSLPEVISLAISLP